MPLRKGDPEKYPQSEFVQKLRRAAPLNNYLMNGGAQRLLFQAVVERTLEKGGLSPAQNLQIESTAAELNDSYKQLIEISEALSVQDRGVISNVILNAYLLGHLCSNEIRDGTLSKLLTGQAKLARQGRERLTAENQKMLKTAILAVAPKDKLNDSEKYAGSILSDVLKILPQNYGGGKSVSTIRRAVRVILQE